MSLRRLVITKQDWAKREKEKKGEDFNDGNLSITTTKNTKKQT